MRELKPAGGDAECVTKAGIGGDKAGAEWLTRAEQRACLERYGSLVTEWIGNIVAAQRCSTGSAEQDAVARDL